MAIAPGIPGLEVTITVGGEPLPEYDYEDGPAGHDEYQITVAKYIEAPAGAEFGISTLYKQPFSPMCPLGAGIMLDGRHVPAPFLEWDSKEDCEGYKYCKEICRENDVGYTRRFLFSALETEEDDHQVTEDRKRQVSCFGQISIYPKTLPEEDNVVSQKTLKATTTPGDTISFRTSLSAPERSQALTMHTVKTQKEPFAEFAFYYRSTAALKSLGIIARTPSPSPARSPSPTPEPEQRNVEDMTEEEMRAELCQLREQRQQDAVRVKREREREDGVATLREEEEEDVKFVEERAVKRVRQLPGEGDEVVELDDD